MSIGIRLRRSARSKGMCSAIEPHDQKEGILELDGPPRLQLFIAFQRTRQVLPGTSRALQPRARLQIDVSFPAAISRRIEAALDEMHRAARGQQQRSRAARAIERVQHKWR